MPAPTRANVVSSFTIIKGAMIDETYRVFSDWDLSASKRDNLERLRATNSVGASSATWLRDIIRVLSRRFDTEGRDRPLILLAQGGFPLQEWKPILLWHMTRDEFLLRDFLTHWLFGEFEAGALRLRTADVEKYLVTVVQRGGSMEHKWSETTTNRVAASLLRIAVDFGLLRGSIERDFTSYQPPERSFMYLLYALIEELGDARKAISSDSWKLFLLRPSDVEFELLRLHQFRKLDYQVAGSLVQLALPRRSAAEYVEEILR